MGILFFGKKMFIIKDISWRIYMTRKLQLVVIFHVDVGIGVFFSSELTRCRYCTRGVGLTIAVFVTI